jgi:cysteine desulfuration protein SufE
MCLSRTPVQRCEVNPVPERMEHLVASLESLERDERLQMLIDIAKDYPRVPDRIARRPYPPEHRVPGCESEAYVWAEVQADGTLNYYFAVENPQGISAMALAAILGKTLSGVRCEQISSVSPDIIYRIFGRELSMGKSLGLMGIINMVRAAARRATPAIRAGS